MIRVSDGVLERAMFSENQTGLVSRTASIARVYSDVDLDKTERGLEEELRRESCVPPPEYKVQRLRHKGERILHSKHILLTIVILNLIDCALVLGELMLDIHYLKEIIKKSDETSVKFIKQMENRYPEHISGYDLEHMEQLYDKIYLADCQWNTSFDNQDIVQEQVHSTRPRRSSVHLKGRVIEPEVTYFSVAKVNVPNDNTSMHHGTQHEYYAHTHSIWEEIAHGLHKASITILGILVIENFLKLICMGRTFFKKKLEVFDAVVVILSFTIDLVFLKGLSAFKVEDAVLILSFLLPWRVIRVVNSLIVAVLDHEHFRLKMLYQEKKAIASELKILKEKEKKFDFYLHKIEKFCESEGIPKWKIRQFTAMGRKQSTITSMASLALGSMLTGMMSMQQNNNAFSKSTSLQSQESATSGASLDVISETDDIAKETCLHKSDETSKDFDCDSVFGSEAMQERNNNDCRIVHSNRPRPAKRVSFEETETKPLLVRQLSLDESRTLNGNADTFNVNSDISKSLPDDKS